MPRYSTVAPVLKSTASTVSVLTSSELLLSGIDTAVLLPLNASAEPFFPVVQDGLVTVPVLPCPDASVTLAPGALVERKGGNRGRRWSTRRRCRGADGPGQRRRATGVVGADTVPVLRLRVDCVIGVAGGILSGRRELEEACCPSIDRSIRTPSSFDALSVHARLIRLLEAAVAVRFDGADGAATPTPSRTMDPTDGTPVLFTRNSM